LDARAGKASGCHRPDQADTPNADLVWLPLDIGDLDSVRAAAEIAAKSRDRCAHQQCRIMNPPLTRTKHGFESQFAVNHLGVFAPHVAAPAKLGERRDRGWS